MILTQRPFTFSQCHPVPLTGRDFFTYNSKRRIRFQRKIKANLSEGRGGKLRDHRKRIVELLNERGSSAILFESQFKRWRKLAEGFGSQEQ